MGLADEVHFRRGGAVAAGKALFQNLPARPVSGGALLPGQLRVGDAGHLVQGGHDPEGAQGVFLQGREKVRKDEHVQIQLPGVLAYAAQTAFLHDALEGRGLRNGGLFRRAGPQALQPRPVAGVAFAENEVFLPTDMAEGEVKEGMPPVDGARGGAVHIIQLFPAHAAG